MKSLYQSFVMSIALLVLLCTTGCDLEEFLNFISRLDQGDYATASGNQGPYPQQGHVQITFGVPVSGMRITYFYRGKEKDKFLTNDYGIFPARRGKALFHVGDIAISDGPIWPKLVTYPLVTPMTLSGKPDSLHSDPDILNRVRFIYSLSNEMQSILNDDEFDMTNVTIPKNIQIDPAVHKAALGVSINFNQSVEAFERDENVMRFLESIDKSLVPQKTLLEFFVYQLVHEREDFWLNFGYSSLEEERYMFNSFHQEELNKFKADTSSDFQKRLTINNQYHSRVLVSSVNIPLCLSYESNAENAQFNSLEFCAPVAEEELYLIVDETEFPVTRYGFDRSLQLYFESDVENNIYMKFELVRLMYSFWSPPNPSDQQDGEKYVVSYQVGSIRGNVQLFMMERVND